MGLHAVERGFILELHLNRVLPRFRVEAIEQ